MTTVCRLRKDPRVPRRAKIAIVFAGFWAAARSTCPDFSLLGRWPPPPWSPSPSYAGRRVPRDVLLAAWPGERRIIDSCSAPPRTAHRHCPRRDRSVLDRSSQAWIWWYMSGWLSRSKWFRPPMWWPLWARVGSSPRTVSTTPAYASPISSSVARIVPPGYDAGSGDQRARVGARRQMGHRATATMRTRTGLRGRSSRTACGRRSVGVAQRPMWSYPGPARVRR